MKVSFYRPFYSAVTASFGAGWEDDREKSEPIPPGSGFEDDRVELPKKKTKTIYCGWEDCRGHEVPDTPKDDSGLWG